MVTGQGFQAEMTEVKVPGTQHYLQVSSGNLEATRKFSTCTNSDRAIPFLGPYRAEIFIHAHEDHAPGCLSERRSRQQEGQ